MSRQIETSKKQQLNHRGGGVWTHKLSDYPYITGDMKIKITYTDAATGAPVKIVPFVIPNDCKGMKYDEMVAYMTANNIPFVPFVPFEAVTFTYKE